MRRGEDQSDATRHRFTRVARELLQSKTVSGRDHSVNSFIYLKQGKLFFLKLMTGYFQAVIKLPVRKIK